MAACSSGMDYADLLASLHFWDGITCFFAVNVGALVLPLVVFGGIAIALYRYTNGPLVPTVIAILGGSAIIGQLPTGAIQIAVIGTLLMISVGVYILVRRAEGVVR